MHPVASCSSSQRNRSVCLIVPRLKRPVPVHNRLVDGRQLLKLHHPQHDRHGAVGRECQLKAAATLGDMPLEAIDPPPSQVESIKENAELLLPIKKGDTAKSLQRKLFQATISGLTVALAMVPEAVAFSFVAGVSPLVGLWTTVLLGFVAASLGGRPGICSSSSGAVSVVIASLSRAHGPVYVSACAVLAGLLQIAGGVLGLGKFIRLVPHPVMLGFVNGLAIMMTRSQFHAFQGLSLFSAEGKAAYGLCGLTMLLAKFIPKVNKSLPATLSAVAMTTGISKLLKLPVKTLADIAGPGVFVGGAKVLPKFGFPQIPWTLETLKIILPFAIIVATVGSIESLLTKQLLDGMVDDGKTGTNGQEMSAQGAGNILSGLFGGIGGCALLGQSIINVENGGGISRWSGMSMAILLALGIVAFAPVLGSVPLVSLVGIMLLVCYSTFSWSSLRIINKIPKLDAAVIALVSLVTVQKDLATSVLVGTVANALGFAWKQSTNLSASSAETNGRKLYKIHGPLFFGSTSRFSRLFNAKEDPSKVVLDFADSRVMDHSALEAIHSLADEYGSMGKTIHLCHLSEDCQAQLRKLYQNGESRPFEVIVGDPATDPVYQVA